MTKLNPSANLILVRSAPPRPVDEVVLLPLTETPVREELLTEIHARLSGARIEGEADAVRNALAETGVACISGLGVLC